jgi:glycosyltransferase involved in cell wall biosynthesis
MPRIVHITSVPLTFWAFYRGFFRHLIADGHDVLAVSSPDRLLDMVGEREQCRTLPVDIRRDITPFSDILALVRLTSVLRRERPDIVHAHTPKGGFLGMLAAWLAGVPVRIYTVHGIAYVNSTGLRRALLALCERMTCALATRVCVVACWMLDYVVAEGICARAKVCILAGGSACGVDTQGRFNPRNVDKEKARDLRRQVGLPDDALVLGFVGRLVGDKGIAELHAAWTSLREAFPSLHLLLVGPAEERDAAPVAVMQSFAADSRVHVCGMVDDTSLYYSLMDVLVLPTRREGLPYAPLEASAMGVAVVATNIAACAEAVIDGETGLLVERGNAGQLVQALSRLLGDASLRQRMGEAGRAHIERSFGQGRVWAEIDELYKREHAPRLAPAHGKRLCYLATIPASHYYFLESQVPFMRERGYEVHLVASKGQWITAEQVRARYGVIVHEVPFSRRLSPIGDLYAAMRLALVLRRIRPDIVHYSTPKAAAIGAVVAALCRVPYRVYTMRGVISSGKGALVRTLHAHLERLVCGLSHAVTCNSESNLRYILDAKMCSPSKIRVLGKGSSHGVDARGRFNPANVPASAVDALRSTLHLVSTPQHLNVSTAPRSLPSTTQRLNDSTITFGFLGRLAADKGMAELAAAWRTVREQVPDSRLLIVGPSVEPWNAVAAETLAQMRADERITFTGSVDDTPAHYALMSVLVLPSYREGFPNAVLEAAAMEVPAITTDALGCSDAVIDGKTGFIVPVKNAPALAERMIYLAGHPTERCDMGRNARARVLADFDPQRICEELAEIYEGRC